MPLKFQAIKGVRDILPPDSELWDRVEQTAREVFSTYGFGEIRLPIFEETDLFARSIGGETDIVGKEMYTFEDYDKSELSDLRLALGTYNYNESDPRAFDGFFDLLGGFLSRGKAAFESARIPKTPGNGEILERVQTKRELFFNYKYQGHREIQPRVAELKELIRQLKFGDVISLRPEATASVVRAYIEHGMQVQPGNVKLCYMGPMFRRERPQKGRYRQFYQIGAEVLGPSDAPGVDAEVIEMLLAFFKRVDLAGATLHINSIGHNAPNCRPAYVEKLRAELTKVRDQLGADSQRRIETNPLRVLDSKLEHEQAIIETLPRIADNLCPECRAHYAEVKRQLDLRGITYRENWRLVRGLDYYTRTTFEIIATGLGSQNAVCGGGRYDGLVELLGGPPTTKGIGFAIGLDRLILSLQESGAGQGNKRLDVFLVWFGAEAQAKAIGMARDLRDAGLVVELAAVEMKFGKALNLADRLKARHAVIIGDDEIATGMFTVKSLADGAQQKLTAHELFSFLRATSEVRP